MTKGVQTGPLVTGGARVERLKSRDYLISGPHGRLLQESGARAPERAFLDQRGDTRDDRVRKDVRELVSTGLPGGL